MPRQCIFCGGKPVTNEHIFGLWLSPLFPTPPGKKMFLDMQTLVNGKPTNRPRRFTRNLDSKVKKVCKQCNIGWMSELENNVIEVISNIIKGQRLSISLEHQELMASWAVKTAVMIQYLNTIPAVPIRRRKWLYTHHTPPPDTAVWIARYDGAGIATALSRSLFFGGNPKNLLTPDAHSIFFSIGCLIFVVLSIYKNVTVRTEFPVNIAPHLFKIWPPRKSFIYWPIKGFDEPLRQQLFNIDWGNTLVFRLFQHKK